MSNEVEELLFQECKKDHPDITKIDEYIIRVCNNKEDINTLFNYRMSPLHAACWRGHSEIVKRLLENSNSFVFPIDVNLKSGDGLDGRTPLHFACRAECPLIIRMLVSHPNIEVNKGDKYKSTCFHYACMTGSKAIVIELLKHQSINLNATNDTGRSPLHIACLLNASAAVVQLLLDHATINDINATYNTGITALHDACSRYYLKKENVKIIRKLLKQPSIIIDKNNSGYETPLEMCKKRLDDPDYKHNKQYYNEIILLVEDYINQRRWRIFCFLINDEY